MSDKLQFVVVPAMKYLNQLVDKLKLIGLDLRVRIP
jgi:hypothetical protein